MSVIGKSGNPNTWSKYKQEYTDRYNKGISEQLDNMVAGMMPDDAERMEGLKGQKRWGETLGDWADAHEGVSDDYSKSPEELFSPQVLASKESALNRLKKLNEEMGFGEKVPSEALGVGFGLFAGEVASVATSGITAMLQPQPGSIREYQPNGGNQGTTGAAAMQMLMAALNNIR